MVLVPLQIIKQLNGVSEYIDKYFTMVLFTNSFLKMELNLFFEG